MNKLASKTIVVDGTDFHYLERGKGDSVMLVHGTLGDFRTWRQQIDVFAEQYHVIAYSRRYHYPGTWNGTRSDYSASRQGNDLARLIEVLKLGPAHVVASSFGAYVSLFTALNHRALVRSLVLGEPPAFPILFDSPEGKASWTDFDRRAWTPARESFDRNHDEDGVRFFMDGVLGSGSYDKLPPSARTMLLDNVPALKAEVTSPDYLSDFTCAMASRIAAPTFLVSGARSPEFFHRISDQLGRCLPNCERVTVPSASHAIHNQNAGFYNRVVLDFLKRH